ncbi:hypothetical protein ACVXG7_09220 [Enterobacter hormaechei]
MGNDIQSNNDVAGSVGGGWIGCTFETTVRQLVRGRGSRLIRRIQC